MRIALQASRLALPPSDPRHAEVVGLIELFASSAEEVVVLASGSAADHLLSGRPNVTLAAGGTGLVFELRGAARLARELEADLLYCLHPSAPWNSSVPFVIEDDGGSLPELDGRSRWADGLRRAGESGASALIVPDDLPPPASASARRAPPAVSPAFQPGDNIPAVGLGRWGLDRDYVVAWACSLRGLRRLLAAWTWVDGSLGDSVALALLCAHRSIRERAEIDIREMELEDSVQPIAIEGALDLPPLFRGARAYLGAESGPTPQALRWALASGLPIAAEMTPLSDAVTGDAAYLVAEADTRALGAAALTLLVEEEVANRLRARGLKRAESYAFGRALAARLEIVRTVQDQARFP